MKTTLHLLTVITSIVATSALAQSVEKKVALKVPATKTYAGIAAKGGVNIKGRDFSGAGVFTLVDADGGGLADGDDVQIKFISGGGKATYWSESGTTISRIYKSDASTRFKVKKSDAGISLQTASCKFVSASSKADPLAVADAADKATVFELIENPTIASSKEVEGSKAAEETRAKE